MNQYQRQKNKNDNKIQQLNSFIQMEIQLKSNSSERQQNDMNPNNEDSDSSVSQAYLKTKKSGRNGNRKRMVKFVHTCCLLYIDKQGKRQTKIHQIIKYSNSYESQLCRKNAMRQVSKLNSKIIQNAQKKADYCQKQVRLQSMTEVTAHMAPLPFYFHPNQLLYLM